MTILGRLRPALIPISFLAFVVWVNYLASSDLLPDPVVIHWGISLEPDGFVPRSDYLYFSSVMLGIFAFVYLAIKIFVRRLELLNRFLGTVAAGVYFLVLGILFIATSIQISSSDSAETRFPLLAIGLLLLLIPSSLWIFLAFPKIELGEKLVVRLRGFAFLELDYSKIQTARLGEIRARDFGGLGLRISGNKIAFIPSKGPALLIQLTSGEEVAIRVHSGEELLAKIMGKVTR